MLNVTSGSFFIYFVLFFSFPALAVISGQKQYPSAGGTFSVVASNDGLVTDIQSSQYIKLNADSSTFTTGTIVLPNSTLNSSANVWNTGNKFAMVIDISSFVSTGINDADGRTIYQVPNYPFLGFTLGTTFANNSTRWLSSSTMTGSKFCIAYGTQNVSDSSLSNIPCLYSTVSSSPLTVSVINNFYFIPSKFTEQSSLNLTEPQTYSASIPLNFIAGAASSVWGIYYTGGYEALFTTTIYLTVNIKPKYCELETSDMNQTVDMGSVTTSSLNDGDVQRGGVINFNFSCPTYSDVNIHMEISDTNDLNNVTNVLSLASIPNSASGVGIKLKDQNSGSFVSFSSGVAPGSQSVVKKVTASESSSSTGTQRITYTLIPYYTKTGDVTPGKIQAQAKVFFNYE